MTYKEITELVKLINKTNLTEFKLKQGEFEISVRTEKYNRTKTTQVVAPQQQIVPVAAPAMPAVAPMPAPAPAPEPAAPAAAPKAEAPKAESKGNYLEVKSPIVGTFYRSPTPEKGPFVKVGDSISVGQTVCIVEAMKLFNEIESEVAGKIVKVMVEDAQPVEYDQVLFLVEP